MAMLMAELTELSTTLDGWIKRQKLTVAALSRLAFVSRRTIYNILEGEPVKEETLRKLARGLAVHPHSGDVDRRAGAEALHDLFTANGLEPPSNEVVVISFEDELLKRVKDRATADEFEELLDRWDHLTPARRTMLEAAMRAALED